MKSTMCNSLVAAAVCLTTAAAQTLLWEDQFDTGTVPNPEYWSFEVGNGYNGWGNGELQSYEVDNAEVSDGTLKINVEKLDATTFTSARIKTEKKVEVLYGTVEARIKVPNVAVGLWPAFWTLGSNFDTVGWPAAGEIDIMEVGQGGAGSLINHRVVSAAHWKNLDDVNPASHPDFLDANMPLYDDFHLFRLEWTPESMSTYLDDDEIWRFDIGLDVCESCHEFHQPHYFILNVAVGGGFTVGNHSSCGFSPSNGGTGCPVPTAADITASIPAAMEVDYVRVTKNGEYGTVYMPTEAPSAAPLAPTTSPQTTLMPTSEPIAQIALQTDAPTAAGETTVQTAYPTAAGETTIQTAYPTAGSEEDWEGKGKGGKGGKGSGKGMKGGKGKYSDEVLCSTEKGGKGKSKKSNKGKGKKGETVDCATSLRTVSSLGATSAAERWALPFSVALGALATLFWL
jgi:hypothetical protein